MHCADIPGASATQRRQRTVPLDTLSVKDINVGSAVHGRAEQPISGGLFYCGSSYSPVQLSVFAELPGTKEIG